MNGGTRAALVAAALVLASCSSGGGETSGTDAGSVPASAVAPDATDGGRPSGSSPETTEAPAPPREPAIDPALVRIGELVDDDGVLPVETAASIFAALVAPLPGVEPIELEGELPHDLAGAATRRLTGADAELQPDVAAAVAEALEPGPSDVEVAVEPGTRRARGVPGGGGGGGEEPTADELTELVATVITDLEERTGHSLSIAVRARVVSDRSTGGDALTTPIRVGDRTTGCRVALPRSLFGSDAGSVTSTVAHEVWHCFQLDVSESAFDSGPLWMIEGQAEFAGEAYVGGSPSSASPWDTWLLAVDTSLFRRSYDALGLYAVAESRGADVWQGMLAMLGRGNVAAVEALFGGPLADAALAVATAVVRAPAVGAVWESTGPGITGAQAAPVLSLPEGEMVEAAADLGRVASLPVVLAVTAGDVARVSVRGGTVGAVQLPGSELVQLAPGGSVSFCLRPEGCVCPDGSNPGGGAELPAASPGEGAAAVAALDAGEAAVSAGLLSLEEACRRDLVGVWETDVGAVLTTFTAPYGGVSGLSCTGPYRLTFAPDGSFLGGFQATCTAGTTSGNGEGTFTGRYTSDDTTFVITDGVASGTMTIGSITQPLPIFDGFRAATTNPTPYVIEGDQLTVTITMPDGPVVPLRLTRVG